MRKSKTEKKLEEERSGLHLGHSQTAALYRAILSAPSQGTHYGAFPLMASLGCAFWCLWSPPDSRNAKKCDSIYSAKMPAIVLRFFCMEIKELGFHYIHFQSDFRHYCIRRMCSTNRHMAHVFIQWRSGFMRSLFTSCESK